MTYLLWNQIRKIDISSYFSIQFRKYPGVSGKSTEVKPSGRNNIRHIDTIWPSLGYGILESIIVGHFDIYNYLYL